MSFLGIVITILLCICVLLLLKYIELSLDYKKIETKLDDLERENLRLKFDVKTLCRERVVFDPLKFFIKPNSAEIDDDIKEAVKYARDKSHPDNGGLDEDFIKFHKLYQRICK